MNKAYSADMFVKERVSLMYTHVFYPLVIVIVVYLALLFVPEIRKNLPWYVHTIFLSSILTRMGSVLYFNRYSDGKDDSWFRNIELFSVFTSLFLGISYAFYTTSIDHIFDHRYSFSVFLMFLFLLIGGLRTNLPSFKSSVAFSLSSILGYSYLTAHGYSFNNFMLNTLLFYAFSVYLIVSQYKSFKNLLARLYLLDEQKENIKKLKNQINLEEELNKQKTINIQNSRLASLGAMASGIAHEINNPLTIIALNIKTLEKKLAKLDIQDNGWKKIASDIILTVDRASKIIASLRIFSRDDKLSDFEESNLTSIVNDSLAFIQERFKQNNISLIVTEETELTSSVLINKVAYSQVLLNLLNNAFYEMNNRDVEDKWCKIILSETDDDAILKVVDAGTGIDQKIVEKLFTPFFTSKDPGEGTGLGLSISRSMIKNMNGDLYYDNDSTNTTFVIKLPKHQ